MLRHPDRVFSLDAGPSIKVELMVQTFEEGQVPPCERFPAQKKTFIINANSNTFEQFIEVKALKG